MKRFLCLSFFLAACLTFAPSGFAFGLVRPGRPQQRNATKGLAFLRQQNRGLESRAVNQRFRGNQTRFKSPLKKTVLARQVAGNRPHKDIKYVAPRMARLKGAGARPMQAQIHPYRPRYL